jgi:hypothetical protein
LFQSFQPFKAFQSFSDYKLEGRSLGAPRVDQLRRRSRMITGRMSSRNDIAKMLAEIGWVRKTAALPWLMARARRA